MGARGWLGQRCARVFSVMRKLGIYVQVPFCQTKCTYCNFHTGVVASSRFGPYVEAVCREIHGHREFLKAAGVGWSGSLACDGGGSGAVPPQSNTGHGGAGWAVATVDIESG